MNAETILQIAAIVAPCALTIAGAVMTGFRSIDKRLDAIAQQLQEYVRREDCRSDMSEHCGQLKDLRAKVQENSEDIAFLKSKHDGGVK